MPAYAKATADVMVQSVQRYLNGESEHEILLECMRNSIIPAPRLGYWAVEPVVKQKVCTENGWGYPAYEARLEQRETEAPNQRQKEKKARALIEYLMRPGVTQHDMALKYSGRMSSQSSVFHYWRRDPEISEIAYNGLECTSEQFREMWEKRRKSSSNWFNQRPFSS